MKLPGYHLWLSWPTNLWQFSRLLTTNFHLLFFSQELPTNPCWSLSNNCYQPNFGWPFSGYHRKTTTDHCWSLLMNLRSLFLKIVFQWPPPTSFCRHFSMTTFQQQLPTNFQRHFYDCFLGIVTITLLIVFNNSK